MDNGRLKKGYKQTDVGVIPKDWDAKPLGDTGQVIRGASPRPKGDKRFYGGNIPRLMVEDITRDKHWVTPSIDYLTSEGAKQSRLCKRGTLTVVCSGTPTAVGLPALLAIDACIHDGILALVKMAMGVSCDFLFHQLGSLQQRLHSAATHGGTFVNLTTNAFRAFKVALPPTITEQEAIADTLSDVDAFIAVLDKLIAKKLAIKTATMQQLLAGKKRLPGFCAQWKLKRIGDLLTVRHGKSQHSIADENGNCPILATSGEIGRTNSFLYEKPSVLIGRKGTINKPQYIERPFWTIDTLFYTEIEKNNDPKFIFYKFCTINWLNYNEASGVPSLNASTIEAIEFICPKRDEQLAIATILTDMDAEISALEARRNKTQAIKQGMMQDLLSGRTRLI